MTTPRSWGELLDQAVAGTLDEGDPVVQRNLAKLSAAIDRAELAHEREGSYLHDDGTGVRP